VSPVWKQLDLVLCRSPFEFIRGTTDELLRDARPFVSPTEATKGEERGLTDRILSRMKSHIVHSTLVPR
jgi:hypothetical protein